ncbi:uncharacterized protein LOC128034012 [Gossypium raimondii]|uniref:uncharacterized protein LOC128034012 n=1 Tax=Gossypium raimondii TaxID=29730 RepID=UPI00227C6E02|nr:uncharacterized protein LOC128034012 [Gossypium raimondii]
MKEEETVKKYSDRIMAVVNNIRLLGEQFNEARIVEKVISTLPEREELADWRSTRKVPFRQRPILPTKAKRPGKTSQSMMLQGKEIKLAGIGLQKPRQSQLQQMKAVARVAKEDSDHEEQVLAVSCSTAQERFSNGWLLDSGCTNHMTPDAAIFKSLDRSYRTKVKIGNGHFIKAERNGDVLIRTPRGAKDSDTAYTTTIDESKLWHQRLEHANYKSMDQLCRNSLAKNFINSVQNQEVCEVCQLRKQAKLPFPSNQAWGASKRLQLVHTDVCGPMKTESLNGSRYFILFIDDFSRFCWIYFLKQKSEVASVFWKFKTAAGTETGYKLKTLRSDNGTEYTLA